MTQMSGVQVFIFVEGKKTDVFLYEQIAERALGQKGIQFQIIKASELPVGSVGKQALCEMIRKLRKKSELSTSFLGKIYFHFFFMDKDIDDFRGTMLRSKFLYYTPAYHIENHVAINAPLTYAASAAASVRVSDMRMLIGDEATWRSKAAFLWHDWVCLCYFAGRKKIGCKIGYGSLSRVQTSLSDPVDPSLLDQAKLELEVRSGLNSAQLLAGLASTKAKITKLFASQDHDLVFKGTWYFQILADQIRQEFGAGASDLSSLSESIRKTSLAKLDFDDKWAEPFVDAISNAAIIAGIY